MVTFKVHDRNIENLGMSRKLFVHVTMYLDKRKRNMFKAD